MTESLASKINALVLAALCVAGYFYFRQGLQPVEPPNDAWFQSNVVDRPGPVLVKFGAPWCGPCRMLDPELNKLAGSAEVAVVRIDIGEHPELARHYRVSSIPRLFLFDHGKVLADRVGYADYQQLQSWVASAAPQPDHHSETPAEEGESPQQFHSPTVIENPFASAK